MGTVWQTKVSMRYNIWSFVCKKFPSSHIYSRTSHSDALKLYVVNFIPLEPVLYFVQFFFFTERVIIKATRLVSRIRNDRRIYDILFERKTGTCAKIQWPIERYET